MLFQLPTSLFAFSRISLPGTGPLTPFIQMLRLAPDPHMIYASHMFIHGALT